MQTESNNFGYGEANNNEINDEKKKSKKPVGNWCNAYFLRNFCRMRECFFLENFKSIASHLAYNL